jgi:hypothetical protein
MSLADAILTVAAGSDTRHFVVGTVTIAFGGALAMVSGISENPVNVDRSSWLTSFATQVAAGGVSGKRVLIVFVERQPIILGTLGV